MKTLFDLREKKDDNLYNAIQAVFDEPLNIIELGDNSINACIGCWTCWLKTPGICIMKDKMSECYHDYMNSDTVILLMDTAQGFINHQAKAFFDRTIPHYNPYIQIVDGECQHVARYDKYPDMLFYFDRSGLTNQEVQVIEDYLYRAAYQFQSKGYLINIVNEGIELQEMLCRKAKRSITAIEQCEPINKLVIYNGSPRRSGSNSTMILQKVSEVLSNRVEIRDLKEKDKLAKWADEFKGDTHVMFFLPLYVHAMPSHVMNFIEMLKPSKGSISFFIQSGFPESSQSHYLEAYFEQLAIRLERTYIGTAIKGGVEGLKQRPESEQQKMIEPLVNAIVNLLNEGSFNSSNVQQLANPKHLGKGTLILFKIISKLGLINIFWDRQLKQNSAYERRFDRPFVNE